jgi:hypothetical protein
MKSTDNITRRNFLMTGFAVGAVFFSDLSKGVEPKLGKLEKFTNIRTEYTDGLVLGYNNLLQSIACRDDIRGFIWKHDYEVLDTTVRDAQWQKRADVPNDRIFRTSFFLDDKLYLVGGMGRFSGHTKDVLVYTPDRWDTLGPFNVGIHGAQVEVIDGVPFLYGGMVSGAPETDNDWNRNVFRYDAKHDRWEDVGRIPKKLGSEPIDTTGALIYIDWKLAPDKKRFEPFVQFYNPKAQEGSEHKIPEEYRKGGRRMLIFKHGDDTYIWNDGSISNTLFSSTALGVFSQEKGNFERIATPDLPGVIGNRWKRGIVGSHMYFFGEDSTPKDGNPSTGYRFKMPLKGMDNSQFAQNYSRSKEFWMNV